MYMNVFEKADGYVACLNKQMEMEKRETYVYKT